MNLAIHTYTIIIIIYNYIINELRMCIYTMSWLNER